MLALVFLTVVQRWSLSLVAAAGAGVLVGSGGTLALAHMTPADAAAYLQRGAHTVRLLGDHPNLRVVLGLTDVRLQGLYVFGPLLMLIAFAATVLRRRRSLVGRLWTDSLGVIILLCCGVATAMVASSVTGPHRTGWQILALGWVLPLLVTWSLIRLARRGTRLPDGIRSWILLLLLVPYAGAVGSNLPFSAVVPLMCVSWVLASFVVLFVGSGEARTVGCARPAFSVSATFIVVILGVMTWTMHKDGPTAGDLNPGLSWAPVADGSLQLQPADAAAARSLRDVAQREGITRSTPVADLTGFGAGYALMTGGRPLGRAHMYGYTPGSVDAATFGLARESCRERARAWLLV